MKMSRVILYERNVKKIKVERLFIKDKEECCYFLCPFLNKRNGICNLNKKIKLKSNYFKFYNDGRIIKVDLNNVMNDGYNWFGELYYRSNYCMEL